MIITSDIDTAIFVASRFSSANLFAGNAEKAIRRFVMNCPSGIMKDGEEEILKKAAEVLQRIVENTTEKDAAKYLQKIEPVTEQPDKLG